MKDWMPPHWPWYVEGASHLEGIEMIGNTALMQCGAQKPPIRELTPPKWTPGRIDCNLHAQVLQLAFPHFSRI